MAVPAPPGWSASACAKGVRESRGGPGPLEGGGQGLRLLVLSIPPWGTCGDAGSLPEQANHPERRPDIHIPLVYLLASCPRRGSQYGPTGGTHKIQGHRTMDRRIDVHGLKNSVKNDSMNSHPIHAKNNIHLL